MRDTVIYIGSIMLPDKSAGAQRALSLSKSLRNLGYNVILVGMEKGNHIDRPILSTKRLCQGFDSFSVPQPKTIKQWIHHTVSAKEFIDVISAYGVDRIKCVILMEYEAIPLIKMVNFCRKYGIPLVADAEEWYENSHMHFPMNLAKDFDTWLRMYCVYPLMVKNMICISRFFENHYNRHIPNRAFIPGTIDEAEEKWKSLSYTPNRILTLGYAGNPGIRFEKERLDLLIRAVVELNCEGKPCRLLLAGIDEQFIEKSGALKDDIARSDGAIELKGHLSHHQCLHMISSCDFSVIIRESKRVTNAGFPTKLSESLGCGTPVLTTRTSNIAEYINDPQWGIVCNDCDIASIKSMIEHAMLYTSEELVKMHINIRTQNPLRYSCFDSSLENFLSTLL